MSFWIQHGYGKGDKIAKLASAGNLDGVILSPADEPVDALKAQVDELTAGDIGVLLDPQLYVHTISGGTGRCHELHGLDFDDVHWSADPKTITRHVRRVLKANERLGIRLICAPTPIQGSFGDTWTPLALQYARAVSEEVGADRTIASVVVDESALGQPWADIEDWLDAATKLDVAGFYLVVVRPGGTYPLSYGTNRLAQLLRLIHRLAVINEYRVLLGYSDFEGLAANVFGAEMATGWFYSQRRFTETKWRHPKGGAPTLPRFTSDMLMSPLLADEGRVLLRSGYEREVNSLSSERARLTAGYTISQSRAQHLRVMARLSKRTADGNLDARLAGFVKTSRQAERRLRELAQDVLPTGVTYANSLAVLSAAAEGAAEAEGIGSL